jgi:hypothetical protein
MFHRGLRRGSVPERSTPATLQAVHSRIGLTKNRGVPERNGFGTKKPLAQYDVHASCPLSPESRILSCMASADPCAELQELKRQYESALRIWAQYEFPLHNEPVGTRAQRLEHLRFKQRALEERNAANDQVLDHKRICPLCIAENSLKQSRPTRGRATVPHYSC